MTRAHHKSEGLNLHVLQTEDYIKVICYNVEHATICRNGNDNQ